MRAEELMTRKLSIVTPDVPVKDVARLLALRGVGAAPVVSPEGELVGIISRSDLLRLLARPDRMIAEDVRGAVEAAGFACSPRPARARRSRPGRSWSPR